MDLTQFTPSSAMLSLVLVALVPFVAVMVTSFTKIIVVLSLLRNALGVQQVPPNIVLNALAIILSVYVMYPVGLQINDGLQGQSAIVESTDGLLQAADTAKEPLKAFMIDHASEREIDFFFETLKRSVTNADSISKTDLVVLVPAFIVSELTKAFQIGFLIFLPFIIIDLVIANILMAMGMFMLSPTAVSLPFKLLLFVLIEGWAKLVHGLVLSYL